MKAIVIVKPADGGKTLRALLIATSPDPEIIVKAAIDRGLPPDEINRLRAALGGDRSRPTTN